MQLQEWDKNFLEKLGKGGEISFKNHRGMGKNSFIKSFKESHPDLYNKYFYANTN